MSEEEKKIEEENKEVETTQESVSDEAMSNIKDSSTWIDALLVVVYLIVISFETEERPYPFNSLKNSEDD